MKSRALVLFTLSAIALFACGPAASPEATLGVTPDEFIAEWNRNLTAHEDLQLGDFDTEDGSSRVTNFSDQWGIELTVDPESGELITTEVWGSMDAHTDQLIMLFATLIIMVQASNPSLDSGIVEAWESVSERAGFPHPENEDAPWMNEQTYTSENEIEGITYTFEKSGHDVALTAHRAD